MTKLSISLSRVSGFKVEGAISILHSLKNICFVGKLSRKFLYLSSERHKTCSALLYTGDDFMLSVFMVLVGVLIALSPLFSEFSESYQYINVFLATLVWVLVGIRMILVERRSKGASLLRNSLKEEQESSRSHQKAWEDIKHKMIDVEEQLAKQKDEAHQWRKAFESEVRKVSSITEELEEWQSGSKSGSDAVAFLSLMQQKGRLVDFLMGDINNIPDDRVGAAARVIHQGCSRVLQECFTIKPVAESPEGHDVKIESDYDPFSYRLVGNVADEGPYSGRLLHKGWISSDLKLPEASAPVADGHVITPAEIQLN